MSSLETILAYNARDSRRPLTCNVPAERKSRALELLEQCAAVVTDPFGYPMARKPSAQSVMELLDAPWRSCMWKWCMQVLEYYKCSNQTSVVAHAFALLDRVALHRDPQLVLMVCLMISLKLLEGSELSTNALQTMARGRFTKQQVRETELEACHELGWRLHQTTLVDWLQLVWDCTSVEEGLPPECMRLAERAIIEGVSRPPSTVAVAILDVVTGDTTKVHDILDLEGLPEAIARVHTLI